MRILKSLGIFMLVVVVVMAATAGILNGWDSRPSNSWLALVATLGVVGFCFSFIGFVREDGADYSYFFEIYQRRVGGLSLVEVQLFSFPCFLFGKAKQIRVGFAPFGKAVVYFPPFNWWK